VKLSARAYAARATAKSMDIVDLEAGLKAVAAGGHVLNCQEVVGIQASLTLLQRQQKHPSIHFWGKVFGMKADYYLAFGLSEAEFELPAKAYYWAGEDFEFKPLPKLTAENVAKMVELGLDKPFAGDPGKSIEPAVDGEEAAEEGGEEGANLPPKLTELDRLAMVVQDIEFDTAVVPRGAHVLNEAHVVVRSSDFKGLAASEATSLSKYVHFRPPASIAALRAMARTDAEFYANFLDGLDADLPKGCWAARQDHSANFVTLRSLSWPGYVAYHFPETTKFGGAYFGYAQKCRDLPFML